VLQLANYAFPFLIGRIRTGKGELILVEGRMFPFLIGRIRTDEEESKEYVLKDCFHSS